MRKTILVVSLFAILLVLPPMAILISGWQWAPENQFNSMKWLLWLTNTAGAPYSIITSLVLIGIILFRLRAEKSVALKVTIVVICALLLQQGTKTLLKSHFQEPRPYVVWLEEQYDVTHSDFYELTRAARAKLIKTVVKYHEDIAKWQRKHWQAETGYSFPSGHMLFAAGWALLFIAFFWQRGSYVLCIGLALWAEGIAFSRMLLGMHWPIDVITSVLISAIFAILAYGLFLCFVRHKSRLIFRQ
ncbi:phosphatase PAP2 family protein [Providencia rettgeri]|uniref:phosphatase PAP2 family protein n=1 Tax=Providencia rettgeri TaxID=587 RepID=UPI0034E0796D